MMNPNRPKWMVPLAALALAALAALACGGGGGGEPGVLFRDDFSSTSSGWSTFDSDNARVAYEDDAYLFEIFETGWFTWGVPEEEVENVRISVTVNNVGDSADHTFGIICNYQDEDNFHFLGIGPEGLYAIGYYLDNESTVVSDPDGFYIESEDIPLDEESYQLEAECASDGTLTLIVNGTVIDSVTDETFTSGDVGLFASSYEQTPVALAFDDFVVRDLDEAGSTDGN